MSLHTPKRFRPQSRSVLLIGAVLLIAGALVAWKLASIESANAASAHQPEPMESVAIATAQAREYRDITTSIGTVLALRSVTLRNEVSGTVRRVTLAPGAVVDSGTVLVGLDVAVEEAELKSQEAQAKLAETALARVQRLSDERAAPQAELDRAMAQHEVAVAQIARIQAIIERKTIRAPFRARVGLSDVHPGQYLNEGTELTTLQGVDAAADVDFTVAQVVAAQLKSGDVVKVFAAAEAEPLPARIVAVDARVDPTTRNALVRARISGHTPSPGASVRVEVPVGATTTAVAVPVSALRKGPSGDHVFVIAADSSGQTRAHVRPVRTGPVVENEVLILSGLNPGEQVAAAGSFKLREAVLVASDSQR